MFFDVPDAEEHRGFVFCVPIRREPILSDEKIPMDMIREGYPRDVIAQTEPMYMGLALNWGDEEYPVMRRIGLVRWVKGSVFDEPATQKTRIVGY